MKDIVTVLGMAYVLFIILLLFLPSFLLWRDDRREAAEGGRRLESGEREGEAKSSFSKAGDSRPS